MTSQMESIRWALRYREIELRENEGEESIVNGEKNPEYLLIYKVIDNKWNLLCGINFLEHIDMPVPIFYRRHSIALNGSGNRIDTVVFGCANEENATLFMLDKSMNVVPAIEQHIDPVAIQFIVSEYT